MSLESVRIVNKSKNSLPEYNTEVGTSFDIRANGGVIIMPGETQIVDTGLYFEIPKGYELQLRSKNTLAYKGIIVINSPAIIDAGYKDMVRVALRNVNSEDSTGNTFKVEVGDKICQGVFVKVERPIFKSVEKI